MRTLNEIKAIASYIGGKVKVTNERYIDGGYIGTVLGVCSVRGILVEHDNKGSDGDEKFEDCKLILKPLSEITDDDAIEVSKIHDIDDAGIEGFFLKQGKEIIGWILKENAPAPLWIPPFDILKIFQLLQSKGYDLPQYLLSGKTLIESGLAIEQK